MTNLITTTPPYAIRHMRKGDLEHIATNLRPADARELKATYGTTDYLERLTVSAAHSEELYVCEADGKPLAVFGLTRTSRYAAVIWCCATRDLSRFPLSFVKESSRVVARWFQDHPDLRTLFNYTHVGSRKSHKWLKSIGAELFDSEPRGANGEAFRLFTIRRANPSVIPVS